MAGRFEGGWVRFGVPGLLLGLALSWWSDGRGRPAQAQTIPAPSRTAAGPVAEANGLIALATNAGGPTQLLYLIDTRTRFLALYRVDPTNPEGTLKLEAARQFQFDLKLTEYNNRKPEVVAIEKAVKTAGQTAQ